MLEIKCPYSRKIDGVIKPEYFSQMQGQLEVCDLEYCDFLECDFQKFDCPDFKAIFILNIWLPINWLINEIVSKYDNRISGNWLWYSNTNIYNW